MSDLGMSLRAKRPGDLSILSCPVCGSRNITHPASGLRGCHKMRIRAEGSPDAEDLRKGRRLMREAFVCANGHRWQMIAVPDPIGLYPLWHYTARKVEG